MPSRTCDRCGQKMSPFIPRKRVDDDLCCAACASGRPGGGNVMASHNDGRTAKMVTFRTTMGAEFQGYETGVPGLLVRKDDRGWGKPDWVVFWQPSDLNGEAEAIPRDSLRFATKKSAIAAVEEIAHLGDWSGPSSALGQSAYDEMKRILRQRAAESQNKPDFYGRTYSTRKTSFAQIADDTPGLPPVRAGLQKHASNVQLAEVTTWGNEFPGQRAVMAYIMQNGKVSPAGAVVFTDQHLISVVVLDYARRHGIARGLIEKADQLAGKTLPDDGYRTTSGDKLMKALNRPKVPLVNRVTEADAMRPIQGMFWAFLNADEDDPDLRKLSMKKGAPFAGYDSFDDCVSQNQDKDDPSAYCGAIKNKAEGRRRASAGDDLSVQWSANRPGAPQVTYREFPHYQDGQQFGAQIECELCGVSRRFVSMGPLQQWKETHAKPGMFGCPALNRAVEGRRKTAYVLGLQVMDMTTGKTGVIVEDQGFHGAVVRFANGERKLVGSMDLRPVSYDASETFEYAARRKTAHDHGDSETIQHCPFCGGGNVHGRSDGTAWCDFCQAAFTVQVQPEHSAMPQTVEGQPFDMPGMPGDPDPAPQPGAAPPGQEPVPGQDQPFPGEDEARWVTSAGKTLTTDDYVAHLAIRYAPDEVKPRVVQAVKTARRSR